ncbi:MAG: GC-type dockerin domain-anchored protein [Phycisphaerales bacterium]
MPSVQIAAIVVLSGMCVVAFGDEPHNWLAPVSGDWDEAANWEPGDIPTIGDIPNVSNECAVFGFAAAYTVTSTSSITHGGIIIPNPLANLVITAVHSVFGDVDNDGTIVLDTGFLDFGFVDRRIDGSGTITLGAIGSALESQIDADDALLTHGLGHTINGNGTIEDTGNGGRWFNDGLIVADDSAGVGIHMDADLEQGADGRVGANGGSLLLQNRSRITGGVLFNINGGKVKVDGPFVLNGIECTLSNVRIEGRIDIEDSYKVLELDGSIQNQGQIVINGNLDATDAELRFEAEASILGSGEVVMHSDGATRRARISTVSGVAGTIGPNMVVRGAGEIEGNAGSSGTGGIVNDGAIIADDPSESLLLLGDHRGAGLYGADGGTMFLANGLRLTGGRLNSQAGGKFTMAFGQVRFIGGHNQADIEIDDQGDLIIQGTYLNDGTITTLSDASLVEYIQLTDGAMLGGSGEVRFDSPFHGIEAASGGTATIGPDQRIVGRGAIGGSVTIEGELEPEGRMDIEGDIVLAPSSVVRVQIGNRGSGDEDRLDAFFDGTIQLGGSLVVELDAGYTPIAGDSWSIVRGEPGIELFGAFDSIILPVSTSGLTYLVDETTIGVRVSVQEVCIADLAAPFGTLNFFDISTFISLYNAGDPGADLAAPFGTLNFFDISAFIGLYNAGCP